MKFSKEEIRLARALEDHGVFWRPTIGDWYVTRDGFVGLLKGEGEGLDCRAFTWIPRWRDCRTWLQERGWGYPEVLVDTMGQVTLALRGPDETELQVTCGSDLACMMEAILRVGNGENEEVLS